MYYIHIVLILSDKYRVSLGAAYCVTLVGLSATVGLRLRSDCVSRTPHQKGKNSQTQSSVD